MTATPPTARCDRCDRVVPLAFWQEGGGSFWMCDECTAYCTAAMDDPLLGCDAPDAVDALRPFPRLIDEIAQLRATLAVAKAALTSIATFGHAAGCEGAENVPVHECGCYAVSEGEIAQRALDLINGGGGG